MQFMRDRVALVGLLALMLHVPCTAYLSMCAGKTLTADARRIAVPGKSWLGVKFTGVGAAAGQDRVPNDAFATLVDTSDAWISKRTGIRSRHVVRSGSTLRDLSAASAKEALLAAGIDPADIDLVILATSSPDDLFGDAVSVAWSLGAVNAAGFGTLSNIIFYIL